MKHYVFRINETGEHLFYMDIQDGVANEDTATLVPLEIKTKLLNHLFIRPLVRRIREQYNSIDPAIRHEDGFTLLVDKWKFEKDDTKE